MATPETQIYPILTYLGCADEHDIQAPAGVTIETGAIVNLNGMWGIATQQINPGDHGTIKFATSGLKLECAYDNTGASVAAGGLCSLDRETGIVVGGDSAAAEDVNVHALPKWGRDYDDADAAATTGVDTTITVVLRDNANSQAADAAAVRYAFTGTGPLN